jgi:tetratricopeptide (TPR) repeat protein
MFSPGEYAMVVSDKATSVPAAAVAAGAAHATGAAASVAPDGAAAEAAANDGDDARGSGDVLGAIRHYSRAIELCPNKEGMVDLLLDRAEVQLLEDVELQPLEEVQARPREALADCDVALSIAHEIHRECSEAGRGAPPLETRAHIARAKALAMLGRYEEAHDDMSLCVDYIVERDEQVGSLLVGLQLPALRTH